MLFASLPSFLNTFGLTLVHHYVSLMPVTPLTLGSILPATVTLSLAHPILVKLQLPGPWYCTSAMDSVERVLNFVTGPAVIVCEAVV